MTTPDTVEATVEITSTPIKKKERTVFLDKDGRIIGLGAVRDKRTKEKVHSTCLLSDYDEKDQAEIKEMYKRTGATSGNYRRYFAIGTNRSRDVRMELISRLAWSIS